MASMKHNQLTKSLEWAKHLRKKGKRRFWKIERMTQKRTANQEAAELEDIAY